MFENKRKNYTNVFYLWQNFRIDNCYENLGVKELSKFIFEILVFL